MKVLVHSCCAPCSVYPVDALGAEGAEMRLYFFNPNIQPYKEYEKRRDAMTGFAEMRGVPLIMEDRYDPESWMRMVVFREARRCLLCYRLRIESAARIAKKGEFEAFTTTLLYSKQQNHDLIRELCEAAGEEVGVPFLYRDFRKGWKEGIEKSKEMGLYRQQYCGCLFSERDRWLGAPERENGGRDEK